MYDLEKKVQDLESKVRDLEIRVTETEAAAVKSSRNLVELAMVVALILVSAHLYKNWQESSIWLKIAVGYCWVYFLVVGITGKS